MSQSNRPSGMTGFTVVWVGQVISMLGTGMTRFALTIWAWQLTGSATALALVGFFSFGPIVLFSPVAGALVDRWNRKLVMMLSDLAAGMSTVAIFILYATGHLEIWHLYVAGAFAGTFESFQFPAYSAAITTMVDKKHYARTSGMLSLAESISGIAAPALAGLLLVVIGINGILIIDMVTFVAAVLALLMVAIPQPPRTAAGAEGSGSLWQESIYGFRYILARPSLLGLQMLFFMSNLLGTLGFTLLAPMILARTDSNSVVLGTVQSAFGVGGVVGGLLLTTWGGPKRRVHGVLLGFIGVSLLGQTLMGLGQILPVWVVAAFFFSAIIPILNGSNQAIWQQKVAPDVQGRVFATRRLIAQITAPLAMLMAGPLADFVFEPGMMAGGNMAATFGWLVGTGPGAGMALIFVISGLLGGFIGIVGYFSPMIRNAEDILPDHVVASPTGQTPTAADHAA